MILDSIKKTNDIKNVPKKDLPELANEIRHFLVEKVSEHGGHLASNLGAVELTMALHLAYDPDVDKIIWDVGHQSYTHKLLTGRREGFDTLREFEGMSGFPKLAENAADAYETGHSTTSISAAIGMVKASQILKNEYKVVAVIGDGSMTGGMAFEALNNISSVNSNIVIVLNDNNMSISPSKGGMHAHLSKIRAGQGYNDLKEDVIDTLMRLPRGEVAVQAIKRTKNNIKHILTGDNLFDMLGITYIGPINGHDTEAMAEVFSKVKHINHPVLVHVVTQKGRGYAPALKRPDKFHGIGKFDVETGKPLAEKKLSYTDVFSKKLCNIAKDHPEIVAITAAMSEGTGLNRFAKKYPDRFFDVGIAEQHAVTFAAGMAAAGVRPVVAIYSTFLQRAYDQIMIDVCLQNLPVIFAIDRAGLVGADGQTHQGAFDISYLSHMPNMTILAPANAQELEEALDYAVAHNDGPIAIRYPRGNAWTCECETTCFKTGRSVMLSEGRDIAIAACGDMVKIALEAKAILASDGFNVTVVNAGFIKPLDTAMLDHLSETHRIIVTLEDNSLIGGFGSMVNAYCDDKHPSVDVFCMGIPDEFIEHGSTDRLMDKLGLDAVGVARAIKERAERSAHE